MSYCVDISEKGICEAISNIAYYSFASKSVSHVESLGALDDVHMNLEYWQETLDRIMYILEEEHEQALWSDDYAIMRSTRDRLNLIKSVTGKGFYF